MTAYIAHLLSYIDPQVMKPLKVVVNAGNGCAGPVLDALEPHLPFRFIKICHAPDPTFPHGVPNPLLPENRRITAQAVKDHGAAVGLAWDGDFDRCFFFDEQGSFIEGYYLVGFIAAALLAHQPGAAIIHDPRLTWNTIDMVREAGGRPVMSKTGHAFIKERMRAENALYGGEMSGHHYFRDFAFCDSGMIPWLLVLERMCRAGQPLSALVRERMARYPVQRRNQPQIARPRCGPPARRSALSGRSHRGSTAPTASAWNSPPGVSTCANPTPNPSSASMWKPAKTRPCLRPRPTNSWP